MKKPLPLLLILAPLLANGMALADDAKARWVHGSWVNVRESSRSDGKILAQLVTNTPVILLGQIEKSCEIRWEEKRQGYIPCRLLGDAPLRLSDTVFEFAPPDYSRKSLLYSPPRSFWIAPSMAGLFDAGQHFQRTLLAARQYALESGQSDNGACCGSEKPPKLLRFPVAEFEAMKAVMSNGIIAGPDHDPPLLSCRETRKLRDERPFAPGDYTNLEYPGWREKYPHANPSVDDCLHHDLPKLALPAIRPSLFKDDKQIAPGGAGIERLGAHFGIVEKGRTTGTPKWERDYDFFRYTGAWDIGMYELKLEAPIVEHVIGRSGLLGAYRWQPELRVTPFGTEGSYCREGFKNQRMGRELLAGYPTVKDALFWFQATTALPFTKAGITSRTLLPPPGKQADENQRLYKVVIHEIDLDNDKVPEFVLWDSWTAPQISGPDPLLASRRLFININGEWHPFDSDGYGECT